MNSFEITFAGERGEGAIVCHLDGTVRNIEVPPGAPCSQLETYRSIHRVDLGEYRRWIGDTAARLADRADILSVGYFTQSGIYEPPEFDWRLGALRQHLEDGERFSLRDPFNYVAFRWLEVEGCVKVDDEGGVQVAAEDEAPQIYSVYARVPEHIEADVFAAVQLADFEAAEHGNPDALSHAVRYAQDLARVLKIGVQVQRSVTRRPLA
jgi:hypothetical protein